MVVEFMWEWEGVRRGHGLLGEEVEREVVRIGHGLTGGEDEETERRAAGVGVDGKTNVALARDGRRDVERSELEWLGDAGICQRLS